MLGGEAMVPAPPDPEAVATMVETIALPWFRSLGNIEGVKRFLAAPLRGCIIQKRAMEVLEF